MAALEENSRDIKTSGDGLIFFFVFQDNMHVLFTVSKSAACCNLDIGQIKKRNFPFSPVLKKILHFTLKAPN